MVSKNYIEPYKITLVGWINKTLDLALTRKNIMSRFKGTRIWPFNPRAMDSKISLNTLYTLQNQDKEEKEPEQEDDEQDWIEHTIVKELININSTTKVPNYYFI